MIPDTNPIDALDTAVEPCADCTATTRWERRDLNPTGEAWLGTCETCGSMTAFVPGEGQIEIEDPLGFFLLGTPKFEPAPPRPAWQRFYARTLDPPFNVRWSFLVDRCDGCQAGATVATTAYNPRGRRSLTLCLNCGFTRVDTEPNAMPAAPIRLTGSRWSPPDPGVKTLRESIFEPYRRWVAYWDSRRRMPGED